MTGAAGRVRAKTALLMPAFGAVTSRLWQRDDLAALYPDYLVTMHQMVRATVPLMDAAIAAADRDHSGDPVAAGLARYLRRHRKEEAGHDRWVAEDLAAVVDDGPARLGAVPGPHVASCVGAQYYWIEHHHPVALLGHIAVLEGHPPHPDLAAVLQARTGLPPAAFRTLRMHALIDRGHAQEVFATIDALPMRPEHERVVGLSALHTLASIVPLFAELAERSPVTRSAEIRS